MKERFQFHFYNPQMHSNFFNQDKYAEQLTSRKTSFTIARPFSLFKKPFKMIVTRAFLDFCI